MATKRLFFFGILIALMMLVTSLAFPQQAARAQARSQTSATETQACLSCHEDQYFLYDTGKWFCIRESPMQCVDCHGGDPYAFKQEDAHANRKPHPIINEDVSKCQECHPEECDERVMKFEDVAGINDVLVAVPYQPEPTIILEQSLETQASEVVGYPGWISAREVLILVLITVLALIIYFIRKTHHA